MPAHAAPHKARRQGHGRDGHTSEGHTSEGVTSEGVTSEGVTSEGVTSEGVTGESADGREGVADPGPQHRLRMCQLAAHGAAGVSVCAAEIERRGVSYTVDTLTALHASHPHAELTLIVGADVAATIGSWRDPARLLELARVAIAARSGAAGPLELDGARIERIEMPAVDVSSSLVRSRVARGEPVAELVGPAVASYIAEHRLYRFAEEASA
jgi:nicotinate-nucleotide adenylyltransferase